MLGSVERETAEIQDSKAKLSAISLIWFGHSMVRFQFASVFCKQTEWSFLLTKFGLYFYFLVS